MEKVRILPALLGVTAVAFYGIHGTVVAINDGPQHLLWSCHLGCLLVGIGLLAARPCVFSIGLFWLLLGVPLWIVNVVTTGDFMTTSLLTHVGGLAIAAYALRRVRIPRGSWAAALAGLVALGAVTRALTPASDNINLSHAVWAGWESRFPSYPAYVLMLLAVSAVMFYLAERIAGRLGARVPAGSGVRGSG